MRGTLESAARTARGRRNGVSDWRVLREQLQVSKTYMSDVLPILVFLVIIGLSKRNLRTQVAE